MCRKWFLDFLGPPQIGGRAQNFVKNEKNQSCSKLPKMARKLVKNDFWTFQQMFTDVYKFASKCAQICACFFSFAGARAGMGKFSSFFF